MPNRIIKESICTSDTIDQLTAEEERFFYRLLVQADDFGRFDGRAPVVLAGTFPLRAHEITIDQVEAWLQRLAEVDLIRFYHVNGRRYLYFTTWDRHQQKRAKHSKYPDPPADVGDMKSSDITCNHGNATDSTCPRETRNENTRIEKRDKQTRRAREDDAPSSAVGEAVSPSVGSSEVDLGEPHDSMTLRDVGQRYQHLIGIMSSSVIERWNWWHEEHGVSFGLIAMAIDETAVARNSGRCDRPDSYIDGIIRNKVNDGIKTAADWITRQRADPRSAVFDESALDAKIDEVLGVMADDARASA